MKKKILFYLFYLGAFLTLFYGAIINNYRVMFLSTFTFLLYLIFDFIIVKFNLKVSLTFKFSLFLFLFCSEVLGEVFSFYSHYSWWDNILHFVFGIIVSYIGYLLFTDLTKIVNKKVLIFGVMFSFLFSLSIGTVWEFVEFSYDRYFGSDMQKDCLLDGFNTTYFGLVDDVKSVNKIYRTEVYTDKEIIVIDGGYLDIGLFDTIYDLLFSVSGSLCFVLYIFLTKKDFI